MAWTQADIDALKKMLIAGQQSLRHGDTSVTQRSVNEIKAILEMAEAEVNGNKGRTSIAAFKSGF